MLAPVTSPRSRKTASAGVGRVDQHDPTVVALASPLDEPALVHPVDDPGRARDRHVERLGELAHRQRAVGLEHRQDVQVDEAERAAQPGRNAPMRSRGFQAVSSSSKAPVEPAALVGRRSFNGTLTIYAMCNVGVNGRRDGDRAPASAHRARRQLRGSGVK